MTCSLRKSFIFGMQFFVKRKYIISHKFICYKEIPHICYFFVNTIVVYYKHENITAVLLVFDNTYKGIDKL